MLTEAFRSLFLLSKSSFFNAKVKVKPQS